MSLSVNSTLSDLLRGSSRPVVGIVISTKDDDGDRTIYMSSAPGITEATSGVVGPAVIAAVRPASYSVDPRSRAFSVGQMSIDVSDPGVGSWWRTIRSDCYLPGSAITLYLGHADVATTSWLVYWAGKIDQVTPGRGYQTITASGGLISAARREIAGLLAWKHPAELAEDITDYLGLTSSMAYDTDTTKSHYVSRLAGVSWDGGDLYDIEATGAIDDSRVLNWRINGLCNANSNSGRIYPEVLVTETTTGRVWIGIALYRDESGDEMVGFGFRDTDGTNGTYTVTIGAPTVPPGDDGTERIPNGDGTAPPWDLAITGTVQVVYAGSDFSIAQASTSYISGDSATYGDKRRASELLAGLAQIANAAVVETEDGTIKWIPFDSSAAAVDHWDASLLGDTLQVVDSQAYMTNEVRITTQYTKPSATEYERVERTYVAERAATKTLYGGEEYVYEIQTPWCNAVGALISDITDSATTVAVGQTDILDGAVRNYGMTGTVGGGTAARAVNSTASRYAYLEIEGGGLSRRVRGDTALDPEIIRADNSSITATGVSVSVDDPLTETSVTRYHSFNLSFTNCSRGKLGTTAAAHYAGTLVYDVTQQALLAAELLDRFEHGVPVVRCTLPIWMLEPQVCELVTIDEELVSTVGIDGITSAKKWEIIGKEIDPLGDSPGVHYTLALAECPLSNGSDSYDHIVSPPSLGDRIIGGLAGGNVNGSTAVIAGALALCGAKDWVGPGAINEADKRDGLFLNAGFAVFTDDDDSVPPERWDIGTGTWDTHVSASTTSQSGKRSLLFNTAAGGAMVSNAAIPVEEGQLYSLRATMRSDGDHDDNEFWVRVEWLDSSGASLGTPAYLYLYPGDQADLGVGWRGGDTWIDIGPVYGLAPSGARTARVDVFADTTGDSCDFYIDNVKFEEAQPYAGVRVGSAQSLTASTTATVDYDSEGADEGGGFNTSTNEYTAPVAGLYTVFASIGVTGMGDDEEVYLDVQWWEPWVSKSYVTIARGRDYSNSNGEANPVASGVVRLDAGAKLRARATASVNCTISSGGSDYSSYISIAKID
jgi:hypothetical protein